MEQQVNIYGGRDPRDIPAYSVAQVSRYLGVPLATVRSWIFGTTYRTKEGEKRFQPLIKLPDLHLRVLSFTNLVEVHVLRSIREVHGVHLDRVRKAILELETNFTATHPLAKIDLHTDGLDLFVQSLEKFVNVSEGRQIVIREVVEGYLRRIERDEQQLAQRLYPFTRTGNSDAPRLIVIDPRIAFGRPVLVGTNIPTDVLASRYKAGESIDQLSTDYRCDRAKVEEAIRCEFFPDAA
ncbi:MAG: DUF433 domain-containing protein [Gemmatimonadaceae bacterium]|nr:DUF433 domain-containing protein [Gloeobacterales cyanobacterium ES-bin-141]